jgi:hypothetical protein
MSHFDHSNAAVSSSINYRAWEREMRSMPPPQEDNWKWMCDFLLSLMSVAVLKAVVDGLMG